MDLLYEWRRGFETLFWHHVVFGDVQHIQHTSAFDNHAQNNWRSLSHKLTVHWFSWGRVRTITLQALIAMHARWLAENTPQTRSLGGSQIRGRQKVFTCLKYPSFSATIVGYHTKVVSFSRPRKWLFLFVELCDLSGSHHSLKSPFITDIDWLTKSLKQVQKNRSHFSQATPNWEYCGCPKQLLISTISVWKICIKAVVPNPFVTAARSMHDNFTAAREYSCNSVSMGRID